MADSVRNLPSTLHSRARASLVLSRDQIPARSLSGPWWAVGCGNGPYGPGRQMLLEAERGGLENRCTFYRVPWVRIPPPPLCSVNALIWIVY
jgi:hypothetical protein